MEISSTSNSSMHQVNLTELNINQLGQLKHQLDQELTLFQESVQTLKIAQGKFLDSAESLDKIPLEDSKDNFVMVPLTSSMYVPGTISDRQNVIIDIGTGYYAQKSIPNAKDYFKRRAAFVTEQMEKIQAMGSEKTKIRDTICDVIELKLNPAKAS
ncbi:prefoldin subunit 5-like [Ctenocephalides felis]|uniref:prefoldin subunit 5-like n=1 Tax=Ctenocephalides felis TaxID=7515 RepID=UPI000E6E42FA|nr:prefoldin subunit 5-like [Ctenocephalides felis]XP_026472213.1 prefoldin subunit 5-like [Ctenocephalides felis]